MTSTPATSMQAAADQLQATLDTSSKDATKLRRTYFAHQIAAAANPAAPPPLSRQQFIDFACQGVGAYAEQRTAIGGVRQLGTTVDVLNAPPSAELAKVLASLAKFRTKLEPLPDNVAQVEAHAFAACQAQTADDLNTLLGDGTRVQTRALPAVLGAFAALQALVTATQKLVLLGAQQADIAQRAARFREFMNDPQTLKVLRLTVSPCVVPMPAATGAGDADLNVGTWPVNDYAGATERCFAKVGTQNEMPALSNKKMTEIIAERRRLSLLAPYHDFMALNYTAVGANGSRSQYLASVAKVDQALATFDGLRELKVSKKQQLEMAVAINELWRISQGRLTSEEELQRLWGAAQTLAALFQNASDDIGGVQDKWKAFIDALQKI